MLFKEFFELWCMERDCCEVTQLLRVTALMYLHKQVLPQESREAFVKCPSVTFLRGVTSAWAVERGLTGDTSSPRSTGVKPSSRRHKPRTGRTQHRVQSTEHQTHRDSNPVPPQTSHLTSLAASGLVYKMGRMAAPSPGRVHGTQSYWIGNCLYYVQHYLF